MRIAAGKYVALLACALACAWAAHFLATRTDARALDNAAQNLTAGQTYEAHVLLRLLSTVSRNLEPTARLCEARALRSVAITRVSIYETGVSQGKPSDADWQAAHEAVGHALACTPTDGFLWLLQFRLETAVADLSGLHLDYLAMSFKLAPNEGWVIDRRAALAAPFWPRYSDEIRAAYLRDLHTLLAARGSWSAMSYLKTIAMPARLDFIASLETASSSDLDRLAASLAKSDLLDLTAPLPGWISARYCPSREGRFDLRCVRRS